MSLRRKHYPRSERSPQPSYRMDGVGDARGKGLLLDDTLDSIICNMRDPFATYVDSNNYLVPPVLDFDSCMDSVVAGVAEALGLPQGLSFEDVFDRIK